MLIWLDEMLIHMFNKKEDIIKKHIIYLAGRAALSVNGHSWLKLKRKTAEHSLRKDHDVSSMSIAEFCKWLTCLNKEAGRPGRLYMWDSSYLATLMSIEQVELGSFIVISLFCVGPLGK